MKKLSIISLGCDKNRVDTEKMIYSLMKGGYAFTENYDEADGIIVNTCAFILPSREESINTILEMCQYKKNNLKCLIVTGCLPQKYLSEIQEGLPEVDAFLGTNDYDKIVECVDAVFKGERYIACSNVCPLREPVERIRTTPPHYAYLKIADGCDNHCTFCAIPSIRGRYRSYPMEDLIEEAKILVADGVKEIILVAQDVTRYGVDRYGKNMLIELIKALSMTDITWIRLMYSYPELVSDELIDEIKTNPKVVKYIDVPLQHINDRILKMMNRRQTKSATLALLDKLYDAGIAVRTTLMVGFPTETTEQFMELLDFVKNGRLTHIGVFAYCTEGASANIRGKVSKMVKLARVDAIGKAHLINAQKQGSLMIGKKIKVLYEGIDYERQMFYGRAEFSAPEIDSYIYFTFPAAEIGEFYEVLITDCDGYDLIGKGVRQL